MTTMIEKIAKAICFSTIPEYVNVLTDDIAREFWEGVWSSMPDDLKEAFKVRARGAIAAMREPTEAQKSAGMKVLGRSGILDGGEAMGADGLVCNDIFAAYIDAALAEGK